MASCSLRGRPVSAALLTYAAASPPSPASYCLDTADSAWALHTPCVPSHSAPEWGFGHQFEGLSADPWAAVPHCTPLSRALVAPLRNLSAGFPQALRPRKHLGQVWLLAVPGPPLWAWSFQAGPTKPTLMGHRLVPVGMVTGSSECKEPGSLLSTSPGMSGAL